jgi:hypothetical protein
VIRAVALVAALLAIAIDLTGAWLGWRSGHGAIPIRFAALASAIALVPCALAFAMLMIGQGRRRAGWARGALRLPIAVPRGYLGAAVLGGIATLAAMGERFGLYVFLAGIVLIALALAQAKPRRR